MHQITLNLTDVQMADLQAAADRRTLSVEEMALIAIGAELHVEGKTHD